MFKKFFILCLYHEFIFLILYLFKRNYYPGKFVYIEFLKFYLILAILFLLFFKIIKYQNKLFYFFNSFLVCFLINYSILMTFVVNGDRSPSMYILHSINNSEGLNFDEAKDRMFYVFFDEKGQFKKRIEEQLYLNNIEQKDQKFFITNKGKSIIKTFELFNFFTNVENF